MNLEQAILEGRRTLADHPDRDLPLRNRILIWTALGPRKIIDDRYAADGVGLRARFALAKSCVLKVLPIWEEAFNSAELAPIWKIESMHGDMPRQLLEIADHVMSDRSKLVYGSEFYGKGWLFSDNVGAVLYDNRFPRPCVNAVCSAACRCLSVAMNDEYYNENDPDDLDSLIGDPCTGVAGRINRDRKSVV